MTWAIYENLCGRLALFSVIGYYYLHFVPGIYLLILTFLHFVSSYSILSYDSSSNPGDSFSLEKLTIQNTRFGREAGNLTKASFKGGNLDNIKGERSVLMRAFVSNRWHSNEEILNIIRFCLSRRLNRDSVIDKSCTLLNDIFEFYPNAYQYSNLKQKQFVFF